MVQSKNDLFDRDLVRKAELFKALSHPARLQILKFLTQSVNCITGDISDEIPLGRTTVNQHLKELKSAGLIQGHIDGVKTKYCLEPLQMKKMKELLGSFLEEVQPGEGYVCG
jgi:DNA-binding transcriptional ArsR family regulator